MLEQEFHISALIAGQLREELSPDQQFELDQWIQASKLNQLRYNEYVHQQEINLKLEKYHAINSDAVYKRTTAKIAVLKAQSTIPSTRKLWSRIGAVAAAITIGISAIAIYNSVQQLNANSSVTLSIDKDIHAGGNKAYITLSNGKTIQLSSAKNGILVKGTQLTYADGSVVDSVTLPAQLLTLTTPLGGQYQITLSDGTIVYMNAGSSLKYPITFDKTSRAVTLQGEAYFEVFKDKSRPFTVTTAKQKITVLGTHFNVNAYEDEAATETTLLEGSVKVSRGLNDVVLSPGQQSILQDDALRLTPADTEEVMAWKNGDFIFKEETLESIMRKVSRWYNVTVVFDENATKNIKLGGYVSRSKNISAVLKMMELTKRVQFKVEGKKIIVLNVNT